MARVAQDRVEIAAIGDGQDLTAVRLGNRCHHFAEPIMRSVEFGAKMADVCRELRLRRRASSATFRARTSSSFSRSS